MKNTFFSRKSRIFLPTTREVKNPNRVIAPNIIKKASIFTPMEISPPASAIKEEGIRVGMNKGTRRVNKPFSF